MNSNDIEFIYSIINSFNYCYVRDSSIRCRAKKNCKNAEALQKIFKLDTKFGI